MITLHCLQSSKKFRLATDAKVGRSEACLIKIPNWDNTASRIHASFVNRGKQWGVVDLQSTNGTFINNEKVTAKILANGDIVTIGKTQFLVEM